MASTQPRADEGGGVLHKLLSLFTEIRPREVFSALILTLNVFLLLTAYYFLKVVREPLILASGGIRIGGAELDLDGPQVKAYAAAGQALLLIGVVRVYGALAKRYGRMQLTAALALFFASNLLVFYVLAQLEVALGIPFYLWVGCFSLTVLAQFWSFANDVYTQEQGKRLFAIVGVGSSVGALFGSWAGKNIFVPIGAYNMMLLAAGVLMICLWLTYLVHRWEIENRAEGAAKADAPPGGAKGGFAIIVGDKYLLLIAVLITVANWVNTTGEYILDRTLVEHATQTLEQREEPESAPKKVEDLAAGDPVYVAEPEAMRVVDGRITDVRTGDKGERAFTVDAGGKTREKLSKAIVFPRTKDGKEGALGAVIGPFKGGYFFWVNALGVALQLFFVSRIFKYLGVRFALFILPTIALFGYAALAFVPVLAIVRIAKISENATDYSIQNTARHALFLPVSREAKYSAKAAIDTFMQRAGDVLSAVVVLIGNQLVTLSTTSFALVNLALVVVWLLIVMGIRREHRKRVVEELSADVKA